MWQVVSWFRVKFDEYNFLNGISTKLDSLGTKLDALAQATAANNVVLTRIDANQALLSAKLDALLKLEQTLMTDVDALTAAVKDNIAAQADGFAAVQAENANIDKAIAALAAASTGNPALLAQITNLQAATASQRTATQAIIDENTKLAAAISTPTP